jgi:hypothetical protein
MTKDSVPRRNYGPLSALVLCLALWWLLLAGALDSRVASMIVTGVACAMATIAALSEMIDGARMEV